MWPSSQETANLVTFTEEFLIEQEYTDWKDEL